MSRMLALLGSQRKVSFGHCRFNGFHHRVLNESVSIVSLHGDRGLVTRLRERDENASISAKAPGILLVLGACESKVVRKS